MHPSTWPLVRAKHCAFWRRDPVDTPIAGNKRTNAFVLGDYEFPVLDRPLQPDDVDIPRALEWAEGLYRSGDGFLDGELVWGLPPLPGVPWIEAILGCAIWVSHESHSLWAAPWLDRWQDLDRVLPLSNNPWYGKLMELTQALVQQAGGRYPVTQTLMRGPADLAVAVRGHERLALDLYDQPEQVKALAHRCTDVWIQVAQAQFAILPAFDGGYAGARLELFAPGPLVRLEEDATILLSVKAYREFFQACDRRIASSFDHAILHTHSANVKLIAGLLEIPELGAIQVSLDPTGPSLENILPTLKRIQEAGKGLLITHELADAALVPLYHELSARGLALERMRSV